MFSINFFDQFTENENRYKIHVKSTVRKLTDKLTNWAFQL